MKIDEAVQVFAKTEWRSQGMAVAAVSRLTERDHPWLRSAIVTAGLVASTSWSNAPVIPTREIIMPPWNAQQVFEPTSLPKLTDQDTRDEVAPEDTPVKTGFQPEHSTRGIRAGAWMFDPALATGALYYSNVFSSRETSEATLLRRAARS